MGESVNHGQAGDAQADALDAQHRELVLLVDKLIKRDSEGALKAELSLLLWQLTLRTEQHFSDEEAYMSELGYRRLDTHRIMHRQLLAALREHVADFETNEGQLGPRLVTFLKFWLVAHINGIDADLRRASRQPSSSIRPVRKIDR